MRSPAGNTRKKEIVVEYALRNTVTPIGVAEFQYLEKLPEKFKGSLPAIDEIEAELGDSDQSETLAPRFR